MRNSSVIMTEGVVRILGNMIRSLLVFVR